MKLAEDVLIAIMASFRKGILEEIDISGLLRELDLVQDGSGRLTLSSHQRDIWSSVEDTD